MIAVEVKAFVMTMVPAFVMSGQVGAHMYSFEGQSLQKHIEIRTIPARMQLLTSINPRQKKHVSFRSTCDDSPPTLQDLNIFRMSALGIYLRYINNFKKKVG